MEGSLSGSNSNVKVDFHANLSFDNWQQLRGIGAGVIEVVTDGKPGDAAPLYPIFLKMVLQLEVTQSSIGHSIGGKGG